MKKITKKRILTLMLQLIFVCGFIMNFNGVYAQKSQKPNVIIIFCDDMGYADLGVTGSKLNRTPNLDQLANSGVRFTDSYASANVCTPSRAGLLTGRYGVRTGLVSVLHPWTTTGIDSSEVTMATMLGNEGYYSGLIGKWHLGHEFDHLPLQNGFDEFFGMPYSNNMAPCVYMRGNEVEVKDVDQTQTVKTYTQEAIRFIKNNQDRPFFLYLAHNMPHVPLFVSEQFKGKSNNGLYGDVIEELDWSVGRLMQTLKKLDLEENTLVIFSSDNGPWLRMGPHGGCAEPFFQGKGTTWEGGHRAPTFASWKGTIKPKVYTGMTTLLDWFPTLASVTGANIPPDKVIDGKDLSDILFAENGKRADEEFFYFKGNRLVAFRSGDYKLVLPEPLLKGNQYMDAVAAHDTLLFNIRIDKSESTNLFDSESEIVKQMNEKLHAFKKSISNLNVKIKSPGKKPKGYKGLPTGVPK